MRESHLKGDQAELIVAAEAMKRGYTVCFPFGHDARYDLVIEKNGKFKRIQVKTALSDEDVLIVSAHSTGRTQGRHTVKKYTSEEIDAIVAYDRRTQECYYIAKSFLKEGKTAFQLRFSSPKNGQKKRIRWAKNYLDWEKA